MFPIQTFENKKKKSEKSDIFVTKNGNIKIISQTE